MSEYKYVKGLEYLKIENTLENRFLTKIAKKNKNGCMLWKAFKHPIGGHGMFAVNNKMGYAHRYSYVYHVGEIPKGLHVLHKCDVPACVNPEHLFLGTQTDNNRDMYEKGRCSSGRGERNRNAKLTKTKVKNIRAKLIKGIRMTALARQYNVHRDTISKINTNKIWKHIL
jgi:hypothetical protein